MKLSITASILILSLIYVKAQDIKANPSIKFIEGTTTAQVYQDTPKVLPFSADSARDFFISGGHVVVMGSNPLFISSTTYSPPFDTIKVIMHCADTSDKKGTKPNILMMGSGGTLTVWGNKRKANLCYWYIGYEVLKNGTHLQYLKEDYTPLRSHVFVFQSIPLKQTRKPF